MGDKASRAAHLGCERLEERQLLTAVTESRDFGGSFNPYVLDGDSTFELSGSIGSDDVDFFEVNAAAGGYLELRLAADALSLVTEPYVHLQSSTRATRSATCAWWTYYTEKDEKPPSVDERRGVGSAQAESKASVANVDVEARIEATIAAATTSQVGHERYEWTISASIDGTIEPFQTRVCGYDEGSSQRWAHASASNSATVGATFTSNYSGEVENSFGFNAFGYQREEITYSQNERADFDATFPDDEDLQAKANWTQSAYWEIVSDYIGYVPHMAVFDLAGNELTRGTDSIDLLIEESGTYLIAVAKDGEFRSPAGETRSFRRPYTLEVTVPVDLRIDPQKIAANTEQQTVDFEYEFYGSIEPIGEEQRGPLVTAYWATGDQEANILRDAEIAQWEAERGTHPLSIPLSKLSQPPAEATHLAIVADSEAEVLEVDEDEDLEGVDVAPNNFGQITLIAAPVVTVTTGRGTGQDAANNQEPLWKEWYSTWVTIENRSLISQRFKAQLTEDSYAGAKFESMGNGVEDAFYVKNDNQPHSELKLWKHERYSAAPEIVVAAWTTSEPVWISRAKTEWDWLPQPHEAVIPSEIATALGIDPTDGVEEIITALVKLKVDLNEALLVAFSDGPDKFSEAIRKFSKIKGLIGDGTAILKAFQLPIAKFPYVGFQLTVEVDRLDGTQATPVYDETDPTYVRVGRDREAYLALARAELAASAMAISRGWGQLVTNPVWGLIQLELGILASQEARKSYILANDPPDSEFTVRVAPEAATPVASADQHIPIVQHLAASHAEVERFADASYRARNKADGAALAGDLVWEAEQIADAARFDVEAALHTADVVGLTAVLQDYAQQQTASPEEALANLQAGLPEETLAQLETLGISRDSVESFLAAVDADALQPLLSDLDAARLQLLTASGRAVETLTMAVERRILNGEPALALDEQQNASLKRLRDEVAYRTRIGASPAEMKQVATEYIRLATDLALETNNIEELRGELEFGWLALTNAVVQFDPSAAGLATLFDEIEAAGAASAAVETLRLDAALISQHAAAGDFAAAAAASETLLTEVVAQWGADIPDELAYRLFGQLAAFRAYAADGALPSDLPASHAEEFLALTGATVSIDPLDAAFGDPAALSYRSVSGWGGAVSIVGSPASPQVEFVAGDAPAGGVAASYAMIDTSTWQFQTAHAPGDLLAALATDGAVNTLQLEASQTLRLGVALQRGDALLLESVVPPELRESALVSLVDPLSGATLAVDDLWSAAALTTPVGGTLLLQIANYYQYYQEPIELAFTAQLQSGPIAPLMLGQTYATTLLPGEQLGYSASLEAGEVLFFDDLAEPTFDGNDLQWTILSPSQTVATGSTFYGDEELIVAAEAGEYLVVFRNASAQPQEAAWRMLVGAEPGPIALDEPISVDLPTPYGARILELGGGGASLWIDAQGIDDYSGWWTFRQGDWETSSYFGESQFALRDPAVPAYLVLSNDLDEANSVQLEVREIQPTPLAFDAAGALTFDLPLDAIAEAAFDAEQGEALLLDLIEGYGDRFALVDPDGNFAPLSPEAPWVVAKTGTHKVLMTGYGEAFDAKLVRMDAAPRLTPEANAVQGTFAQGDAVQIFQFRPDASLQVQVDFQLGPGAFGSWEIVTAADDFAGEYGYGLVDEDAQPVTVELPTSGDYFLLLTNWSGDGVPFELTVNGLAPASEGVRVTQAIVNGGRIDRSNVHLVEVALEGDEDWQGLIDRGEITQVVELYRLSESAARVELTADRYVWQDEEKRLSVDLSIDGLGGSRQSLLADGRYELALRGDVVIDEDGVDDGRHRFAFHQLAGDFDGDAATTGGDLALWTDYFGAIGAPGAGVADGNADGATGGFDFLMWQRNFGAVAEFAAAAEIAAGPPAATLAPAEDLPVATGRDVGGPLALAGAASAAERPADGARPWRRGEWLPAGWAAPDVAAREAAFADDDGLRVPSSGEPPRVPEAVVRQYLAQRTAAGSDVPSTASRADGVTVRQGAWTQDEALERLGNRLLEISLPGAVRQVED